MTEESSELGTARTGAFPWGTFLWRAAKFGLAAYVILALLRPLLEPIALAEERDQARAALIDSLQIERGSRVITLINREETVRLFGVPVSSYLDIEDSEAVLRAIRLTPPDQPIDLVLHTPGGLALPAQQIAHALLNHPAQVRVFVPHYAMSGGTLLALAADSIVMDPNAVLGPVDPQLGDYPAASIVHLLEAKPTAEISDEMLIMIDVAQKARAQMGQFLSGMLQKHFPPARADTLAFVFSAGLWTHDFPITFEAAQNLGLPVSTNMPPLVYRLLDLYPQANATNSAVSYVPLPRATRPGPR
jgi:ClpP class serine protease